MIPAGHESDHDDVLPEDITTDDAEGALPDDHDGLSTAEDADDVRHVDDDDDDDPSGPDLAQRDDGRLD